MDKLTTGQFNEETISLKVSEIEALVFNIEDSLFSLRPESRLVEQALPVNQLEALKVRLDGLRGRLLEIRDAVSVL